MALDTMDEDLTPEEQEQRLRAREEALLRQAAMTPALETGEETDEQEAAAAKAAGVDVDVLRGQRLEKRFENVFGRPLLRSGLRPFDSGEAMTPPSMTRPKTLAGPVPRAAIGLERTGRVLREPVEMPETVPSLAMPSGVPAKTTDFASLQKLMSPGALTSPIPTASAPVTKDAPAPVASVVPSTGPQTPAGKPESMGTPGLPAPSSEGAGGDVLGRLGLGQALVRALEGSGSVIAGRDLRSGAADTLGERMKQIEALRAKREEQSLVDARERANNRAQVEYLMQRFPERREALAGLLDVTKSPNFAQMLRVEEQIALDKARQAQAAATTGQIQALTPVKVEAGLAGAEGKRAQTKSRTYTDALTQVKTENEIARKGMIAAQAEALRAKAELDKAKAAGAGDTDSRTVNARQKLVDAYQKQYLAPAESLAAVEAKAPGLTRGQPPDWLTGEQLQLVRNNVTYELASDDTKDVFAAAQKYLDGYRKQQYGSALTATEQAELERLVKADIFTGADKLSRFFDLIRKDIANNFQNKLKGDRLVQQSFVDKYVGAEEGPLTKFVGPQGLFSDVWTLPKTPAEAGAAPTKKPSAAAIAKLKADSSPAARAAYDSYFGTGSAARDLGEGQ